MINVLEYLQATAEKFPNKVAFRDENKKLTFAQLNQQSQDFAYRLVDALEEKVRQPVAIFLPKSVDCIVAISATLYSGNFYSPIDTTMPKERLKKLFDNLRPAIIITNSDCIEALKTVSPDASLINISQLSGMESKKRSLKNIQCKVIDADPVYVMFTSGSTGVPKGVVVSHRSVIDYIEWLSVTFTFDERTILGNQAPLFFDNSILDVYTTFKNACETVIIPEEKFLSPKRLCHYLQDKEINSIFWVPSALVLIANSGVLKNNAPEKLSQILFCGEVMPTKHLNTWRQAVPNAQYANLYGPTEITDVCAYFIIDRDFNDAEKLPIGHACRNAEIIVLNEDNKKVLNSESGELCVRGACLSSGYYGNMEVSADSFMQNPLNTLYEDKIYRTGDLVYYNERGELVYLGRKDNQIKHLGYRIELGEIESITISHNKIKNCCAMYDRDSQQIILAITPEDVDKIELYNHLKIGLPRYMLPSLIKSLPSLPLNANSKIDRLKTFELMQSVK